MIDRYYFYKDPVTLEEKFDFLKNKDIAFLKEELNINFDVENLNWLEENIKKFLPIKFQKFKISPSYNFLSKENLTGVLYFWKGKKICLSWQLENFSIMNIINVFTKMGSYSEMNRATYDCFEVHDLNMDHKDAWDKLIELLSKHEFN